MYCMLYSITFLLHDTKILILDFFVENLNFGEKIEIILFPKIPIRIPVENFRIPDPDQDPYNDSYESASLFKILI